MGIKLIYVRRYLNTLINSLVHATVKLNTSKGRKLVSRWNTRSGLVIDVDII